MSGDPLPVRHRPRTFSGVVGQSAAVSALRGMVASGQVPQQLLLSGPSGCGKTTLARILASRLLCESPSGEDACGSCGSCGMVLSGSHPDLVEVDAASYGGKDSILELSARSAMSPLVGSSRVFVIDEAHGLTAAAGQAFLKTLEEPPPGVFFFLCTTDPDRLLSTARSRCVEMRLSRPSAGELSSRLVSVAEAEGWGLAAEVADAIVAASDPALGVRGALNSLAKVAPAVPGGRVSRADVDLLLGSSGPAMFDRLWDRVSVGSAAAALSELDALRSSVQDAVIVKAAASWCRERVLESFDTDRLPVWRRLLAELARVEGTALDAWVVGAAHACARSAPQPAVMSAAAPEASAPSASPARARLLAAASPAPSDLAALLERCQVSEEGSEILIRFPSRISAAVEPMLPLLRTAAGRLGLPLRAQAEDGPTLSEPDRGD